MALAHLPTLFLLVCAEPIPDEAPRLLPVDFPVIKISDVECLRTAQEKCLVLFDDTLPEEVLLRDARMVIAMPANPALLYYSASGRRCSLDAALLMDDLLIGPRFEAREVEFRIQVALSKAQQRAQQRITQNSKTTRSSDAAETGYRWPLGSPSSPETLILEKLVHALPLRTYFCAPDGRLLFFNLEQFASLGVLATKELFGKTMGEIFPSHPEWAQADQLALASGIPSEVTESIPLPGEIGELNYKTHRIPIHEEGGKLLGLLVLSYEISEAWIKDEQLQQTLKMLRATEIRLIQSEKFRTVGRFAAGLAHEVKNPLATLLLGLDFLQRPMKKGESDYEMIEIMRTAVDKANRRVFELLNYAAPEELAFKTGNLHDTITRVLEMTNHQFLRGHVRLHVDLSPEAPALHFDESKIEQVLTNLIQNALHAMPGGGELFLHTSQQHGSSKNPDALFFRLQMRDTGTGIDPSNLDKIFDPFFTTKPKQEGSGLGLSIVKKIIELHGGEIFLANAEPRGVKVDILLPIPKSHTLYS